MIPYTTVQSGTCESEGMKTIKDKKDCTTILNALKKIGFASIYDDGDIRNWRYDRPLTLWHSLFLPYGCLFNDNSHESGMSPLIWNPTLAFQKSLPCGSVWNGHKYKCFCKKPSRFRL